MSRSNNLAGGVYNEGDNTFTLPTTRGADSYVLTRDNTVDSNSGKGTTWKATELAPQTISISPTEVASASGGTITFTLTGTNYASSGMSVHFIATSGSDITSDITVTHTSGTSLSVEIAKNLFVDANEPYSVKVAKTSGLTHTLSDAVRVDNAPSFTASPNTVVATVQELTANNTHYTIVASDLESDAITFEEVGTTLLDKFTSATPRGVQSDGTIKGVPLGIGADNQETTFTVRAKSTGDGGATEKQTDQAFKFVVTAKPQLFAGLAYTGTDATSSKVLGDTYNDAGVNTSRDLKPDLVWIKNRTEGYGAHLYDVLRGAQYNLRTASQAVSSNTGTTTNLTAFETDGFEVGSSVGVNGGDGDNYVAWCFKAGGSASGTLAGSGGTASLTDGFGAGTIHNSATGVSGVKTITQTVNQKGGFSITKYNGDTNSGTATFPHNLDGVPDFVLVKKTSEETWGWWVTYHSSLTDNHNLNLNENYAEFASTNTSYAKGGWIDAPSSTLINLSAGSSNTDSVSYENKDYMCYAWKAVAGVSAFGGYTVSGSSGGSVTGLGFKPRLVIIKRTNGANNWSMFDRFRESGDALTKILKPDDPDNEFTYSNWTLTVTNDGFTTGNFAAVGANGGTYIYIAFA